MIQIEMAPSAHGRGAWASVRELNSEVHDEDDYDNDENYDSHSDFSSWEPLAFFEREQGLKDYMQGKSYLRFVQGQELVRSGVEFSPMTADATLESRLIDYNYGAAFGLLNKRFEAVSSLHLTVNTESHYEAFHCATGLILRRGNPNEIAVLEICCRHPDGNLTLDEETPLVHIPTMPDPVIDPRERRLRALEVYQKNLDHYIDSLIKGDTDEMVEVDEQVLTGPDKRYLTVLKFRGRRYVGRGHDRREAGLRAAKQICEDVTEISGGQK